MCIRDSQYVNNTTKHGASEGIILSANSCTAIDTSPCVNAVSYTHLDVYKRQACGALLTNISAWLSGIWFDVALVGGWFETIANALPFVHAVNVGRFIIAHDYTQVFPELLWVIGYTIVIIGVSIYIFMKKVNH